MHDILQGMPTVMIHATVLTTIHLQKQMGICNTKQNILRQEDGKNGFTTMLVEQSWGLWHEGGPNNR